MMKRNTIFLIFLLFNSLNHISIHSSSKRSFCSDYANEKTNYSQSKYFQYEWEKNYDYCIFWADELIYEYEFKQLPKSEQLKRLKIIEKNKEIKRKREEAKKRKDEYFKLNKEKILADEQREIEIRKKLCDRGEGAQCDYLQRLLKKINERNLKLK